MSSLRLASNVACRPLAVMVLRMVDHLTVPVFQLMVDQVAEATPAKANHMLRYARRAFTYDVQRGHCRTNPAKGTKAAEELGEFKMPDHDVFAAVHAFARQRGALKAHTRGSLSPYLAPAMVLAYGCRLRGLEVNTLTDAHGLREGILCNRLKGSKDNITEWDTDLRAAWAELAIQRAAVWSRRKFPTPLQPEQRFLIVSQSGDPLEKSSLDSAWQRLIDAAVAAKAITDAQRFTLHGLKHRGITDSEDKSAAGHKTKEMQDRYDHELRLVAPAAKRKRLT
ncbi:integrase [Lysobacter yananisis]|uniref:Integrase n=1 Tax=Lysobacter yananisis TaxID=1003114 RepID=A0ABY9P333_9GAMM|nr:integrase [Lysobacter yananisis]WMT01402.1 integrase [Lysobacter yananisis]